MRGLVAVWRAVVVDVRRQADLEASDPTSILVDALLLKDGRVPWTGPPLREQEIAALLDQLLAADVHLRVTCGGAYSLADVLQRFSLSMLSRAPELEQGDRFDDRIAHALLDELFVSEYRRRLYVRLYNVVVDESPMELGIAQIKVFASSDIPRITGESTAVSRLHLDGTGNAFLVFEDQGHGDAQEWRDWWAEGWRRAQVIAGALKYLKHGTVDLDYAASHYEPDWANDTLRYGLSVGGRPRFDIQAEPYRLTRDDCDSLRRYLALVTKHEQLLADMSSNLRRALLTAGHYYEGHYARADARDQLIDLVIALEAVFGPEDRQGELGYRISLAGAILLGEGPDDVENIANFLRKMYGARSHVVHGGDMLKSPGSSEDLARLADLVRQAIVRIGVLFARGYFDHNRGRLLKALGRAAFDSDLRSELQRQSDIDGFLRDEGL